MAFPFARPRDLRRLGILGMNRRNVDFIARVNPRRYYPLVDNKLLTKRAAQKAGIETPELLGVISHQYEVRDLRRHLDNQPGFVIKPAKGSGGKGIVVITGCEGDRYVKGSGAEISYIDLQRHVSNILSGLYSLGGRYDVAMIEALVHFDDTLAHYSFEGVPDIRIVVYQGYPVMAMMRCATHASDGKANLHQGAVGVGIDLASGRAVNAVQQGVPVSAHPDTGESFTDLQIPHWGDMLVLAARCFEMASLGYLGVDIVIDRRYGPLILEVNARPGLAIQIANRDGLYRRLEVVDDALDVERDPLARAAFSRQHFTVLR